MNEQKIITGHDFFNLDSAVEHCTDAQTFCPQALTQGTRRTLRVRLRPGVSTCEQKPCTSVSMSTAESRFNRLIKELKLAAVKRVFLVAGEKSFVASGASMKLLPLLEQYFDVVLYQASHTIISCSDADKCYNAMQNARPDAVIAVGGGAVMDMAKIAFLCTVDDSKSSNVMHNKVEMTDKKIPLLVAVPTTTGSGSESTHFAVIYENKIKSSIADMRIFPSIVLLEPEFVQSVPHNIAVGAGLDAFSQAIESYWSVNSTDESRIYSVEAIKLILSSFESSLKGGDVNSFEKMQSAANLAGRAINITKTTASHAMSYPLTAHFGVPHGVAVFLTLPSVMEFNAMVSDVDCIDKRGCEFVKKSLSELSMHLAGSSDVKSGIKFLKGFYKRLGISDKLSDYGVLQSDIDNVIISEINPERMKNNPRLVAKADVISILESIL